MSEMSEDIGGYYPVQESRVINHPSYFLPVVMTRYGWAKRVGIFKEEVQWYKTEINEMGGNLE